MSLGRVAAIGRFKPLHLGAAAMLEAICAQADHAIVGIGSANKYDIRNPFTPEETRGMIDAFLKPRFSNYSIIEVPDFGHLPEFQPPHYPQGQKWKEHVIEHLGKLDYFVSGNTYVCSLLKDTYAILSSFSFADGAAVKGTLVRAHMARGEPWEHLVPTEVGRYIKAHGLDERFRREFGKQMLQALGGRDCTKKDDASQESAYINRLKQ